MNNFGVIEVAGTRKTSAPGWAYVPDTGLNPSVAALQPTNRKRVARNQAALSSSDQSARQEAKIRKEIEALDRDSHRDVNIPIPAKHGGSRCT
jgi:zinc finger HIT domain-containing protein 1